MRDRSCCFRLPGQSRCVWAGPLPIDGGNTPILTKLGAWNMGLIRPSKQKFILKHQTVYGSQVGTSNPVMMRDTDFGMVRLLLLASTQFASPILAPD